jgi:hypothetical protein
LTVNPSPTSRVGLSVSNNVKAEVATDCAKHGNVKAEVATGKAEVATDCAKHGNVKAEVAAKKAEVATDCAKHGNVKAEVAAKKAEVVTDIVGCVTSLTHRINYQGLIWHNHAVNVSPTLKTVIDQAIQYHPRDRFASAKEMLDALQGIVSPIPPTQPILTQAPTSSPPPPTINLDTPPNHKGNSRSSILMASAIAGGLIGASVYCPLTCLFRVFAGAKAFIVIA